MNCSTLNLFSFSNLDHAVSVIFFATLYINAVLGLADICISNVSQNAFFLTKYDSLLAFDGLYYMILTIQQTIQM